MTSRVASWNLGTLSGLFVLILAVGLGACDTDNETDGETPMDGGTTTGFTCGQDAVLETGYRTVNVNGEDRRFYVRVPANVTSSATLPMVMAFHGTGGAPEAYIDDTYYDLESTVGDEALMVYPEGVPGTDGLPNWIREVTPLFFDAILSDLEGCFDPQQLFVTGHSSGGGAAHDLGCLRGDSIRAVAPVSGIMLANKETCIGEVAVISVHGTKDDLVPIGGGEPSKNYWVARNGCDSESPQAGDHCVAYSGCDEDFPVSWCAHDEPKAGTEGHGHDWPSFGSATIWGFFKSLAPLAPSDVSPNRDISPGDGGVTGQFTVRYPDDLKGTPDQGAASIYKAGSVQPLLAAPLALLNTGFEVGDWAPGASVFYNVPFTMDNVAPGNYTFVVVIYMVGATYPIPLPEVDYMGFVEITIDGTEKEFIFPDPIELELMVPFPEA